LQKRFARLLQAAIVEAAKVRKHVGNRGGLRFARLKTILGGIGMQLKSTLAGNLVQVPASLPA
jgi:hypothetical protein